MSMTLEELRQYKPQIEAILAQYGAGNLRVAGSIVRGEATDQSDVDLIITHPSGSLWNRLEMKHQIEDLIHMPVDLLDEECIHPRIKPYLIKDAKPL